jgi:hypothetical protein
MISPWVLNQINSLFRNSVYFQPDMRPFCRGNSLAEYGVPLAIVGILVVGGCLAVNPAMKSFLQSSLSTQPIQNTGTGAASGQTLSVQPLGISPLTTEAVITLSDGTQIRLSSFPKDLKQSIEAVGGNGTTDLLSNTLAELAQKLKEAGKIDEVQFQSLIKLSQKGHEAARMQGLIDDALERSKRDGTPFGNQIIQYDGKAIPAVYFARLLGTDNAAINRKDPGSEYIKFLGPNDVPSLQGTFFSLIHNTTIGVGLYDLIHSFQGTFSSGVMKEPVVKDLVSQLTLNIYRMTQATASATHLYGNNSIGRSVVEEGIVINSPDAFKKSVEDSVVNSHINSKDICIIGRGTDKGQQCQAK